jgi:hypothetical protein
VLLALAGCTIAGCQPKDSWCQVTLTSAKPKATCAIPPSLSAPPRLVEIPVTKIENPSGQSFSIYLFVNPSKGEPELIGNVTVFPPDRAGVFTLRNQPAFERLWDSRRSARVTVEIRRTLESRPWQTMSVSIGPLRWLSEEPK